MVLFARLRNRRIWEILFADARLAGGSKYKQVIKVSDNIHTDVTLPRFRGGELPHWLVLANEEIVRYHGNPWDSPCGGMKGGVKRALENSSCI